MFPSLTNFPMAVQIPPINCSVYIYLASLAEQVKLAEKNLLNIILKETAQVSTHSIGEKK